MTWCALNCDVSTKVIDKFEKGVEVVCPVEDRVYKISIRNGWVYDDDTNYFYKCKESDMCIGAPLTEKCFVNKKL